ncbi:extracellular solute-binding protein [Paenibacillus roseipurpureus]|uniref:Extracellular solute-binding protein n=1 Tax=Paenibacillus roseopurpureus TaxID=2918901 RepID=A0AA96LRX8_9BACL|nr:extracellular solute-binding protein [Paenibacillus sp. MBLB1832]WNR46139.1 extracellular solute-binding protein [Paenibacillus sp. MBLB1832]
MKKVIISAFALTLTLSLSGCASKDSGSSNTTSPAPSSSSTQTPVQKGPFAKYDKTVEFTAVMGVNQDPKFPAGQSYENNPFLNFVQDTLNVKQKLLWTAPTDGEQYFKKLSISFASGDLPDIFSIDTDKAPALLKQLIDAGQIEDLTQVYKDYASDDVKKNFELGQNNALNSATFGGKLMAIPNSSDAAQTNVIWVRQDWLDKQGLKPPQTLDDLRAIAKAFATGDPDGNGKNDTVGLSVAGVNSLTAPSGSMHSLDVIFNYFNAYPSIWLKDKDGKLVWGGVQPEVKDALAVMADMFKNKELDPEFGVKDNGKTTADLGAGKSGLVFQPWWAPLYPLGNTLQNNPNANWKAYSLPGKDGKIHATFDKLATQYLVVKKGFKNPELAVKLANLSTAMKMNKYPDISKKRLEDYSAASSSAQWGFVGGGAQVIDPFTVESTQKKITDVIGGKLDVSKLDQEEKSIYDKIKKFEPNVGKPVAKELVPDWQQHAAWMYGLAPTTKTPTSIIYNGFNGTTDSMSKNWTSLQDLTKESYLKIIMGREPISYFDTFVKRWNEMGGEAITKEVQNYKQ